MSGDSAVKVYGSGVLFALVVGFSFIGVKVGVGVAGPLITMAYRYNFAFLGTVCFFLFTSNKIDFRGRKKKNIILTACFYVTFMILQAIGLMYATSVESGIIFAMVPIFAKMIARVTLGERSGWKQNAFMCISVSSLVAMIVFGAAGVQINFTGVLVLVLSSLCMAISNVFMRYLRYDEYRPMEISAVISVLGFVIFNAATLFWGIKNGEVSSYFVLMKNVKFLVATAYLGIPSLLLSASLMAYMTGKIEAVKATMFGNLATAISIVAGVVVLREPLYWYHIVCTVMIIIGVIGVSASGMVKDEKRI